MFYDSMPVPKAVAEGADAYLNGKRYSDNPYPSDTQDHDDWNWGFQEAEEYYGDVPYSDDF